MTETACRDGRTSSTSLLRLGHEIDLYMHLHGRVWGTPLIACHFGAGIAADLVAAGFAARSGVSLQ